MAGHNTGGMHLAPPGEQEWKPSLWGRLFSGGGSWTVRVDLETLAAQVISSAGEMTVPADALQVRPGRIWSTVVMVAPGLPPPNELKGLSQQRAGSLQVVVDRARRLRALRRVVDDGMTQIVGWSQSLEADASRWAERWWPRDLISRWAQSRPSLDSRFPEARRTADLQAYLQAQPASVHRAFAWWDADLTQFVADRNRRFLTAEAQRRAEFFDSVESSPLTAEQVKAVVCFDNRVQVIAAAGSGKTSTMVARAAYAVRHDLVDPDRILMLAFNKKAAQELADRVRRRVGDRGKLVTASTFHAFGLRVIAEATGRRPRVPAGLGTEGEGETRLERVVDALRDRDVRFRVQWDLFRLVFSRPLADFGSVEETDAWDPVNRTAGFRTLNNEVVKSREELMLANWLFYNGIRYEYESDYELDTADAGHGRYRPDFYYPDIDVYHEHWALDRHGRPPPQFHGYADGLRWKRDTHDRYGTTLLETTSAMLRDGSAFDYLSRELTARGLVLDPNPDRDTPVEEPLRFEQLITLMRTFLSHFKSNRLTEQQLREGVAAMSGDRVRAAQFIDLFLPIQREWDRWLHAANEIDFEDMVNRAADLIENGSWSRRHELIMVDEMQDSSYARSRLVRALVDAPDRYLFAVGDDWQSINRFAGSDLTVMTQFGASFGAHDALRLERTFRSPQSICDISSAFVTRNPDQLTKQVRSEQPEHPPALRAVAVDRDDKYASVITSHLRQLETDAAGQDVKPDRRLQVLILGRYNAGRDKIQDALNHKWTHLQVTYSTVHSAKGKEADYVIVIDVTAGAFPSAIQDDPLLSLVMPAPELFPHAEERRLFYVALTRTRRSVLLLTQTNRESPFLLELIKQRYVTLTDADGESVTITPCPACKQGRMVRRTNRGNKQDFMGCSRFPKCRHTSSLATSGRWTS